MPKLLTKKRLFFALCRKLGLGVDRERELVRQKFKLKSFADIQEYQLDVVLDQLREKTL